MIISTHLHVVVKPCPMRRKGGETRKRKTGGVLNTEVLTRIILLVVVFFTLWK